jgi:hypothetical protein
LKSVKVIPDISFVSYPNASYTFLITPTDAFTSSAIIYITFPDEISVTNRVNAQLTSSKSPISPSAKLTVTNQKYAVITNAFTSAFTSGDLNLTINQVFNSHFLGSSSSFAVSIGYSLSDIVDLKDDKITVEAITNP